MTPSDLPGSTEDSLAEDVPSLQPMPSMRAQLRASRRRTRTHAGDSSAGLTLCLGAEQIAELSAALEQTGRKFTATKEELERRVAERTRELNSTRRRLEVIVDTMSQALIAFDEGGIIESFNRAAQDLFGIAEQTAIGTSIFAIFGEDFPFLNMTGEPAEIVGHTADGVSVRTEVWIRKVDLNGRPLFVATVQDLTRIKYTQRLLNEQAFLLDKSKSFALTTDATGRIVWCNPHLALLTGYTCEAMTSRRPAEFLYDESNDPATLEEVRRAITETSSYNVEIVFRHAAGRAIWVHLEAYPLFGDDGMLEKYVSLGVDITDRKREEVLQADFISMVSHELRTPLTVISGSLDALEMGIGGSVSDVGRELIDMGRRNCTQLSTLIEDLLDINKLEAGLIRFQSQYQDLAACTQAAVDSIVPLVNVAQLVLRVDTNAAGSMVFVDPRRLHQVLLNLLSNAIKFSPAGKTIVVRVVSSGGRSRVSVEDQGCGVPKAFHPHIFKKFSRDVAVQASGKEGFGLGLCISKALIEQMGGEIGFASIEGSGSCFHIELPHTTREILGSGAAASPAMPLSQPFKPGLN